MLLKDILPKDIVEKLPEEIYGIYVSRIVQDSKLVKNCDTYFCLTNDSEKAEKYCQEASINGASVFVSQFDLPYDHVIKVEDVRSVFAKACANFFGRACDEMTMIGITGTNGKTSTSHIISQILKRNGRNVGVIGTNGVFYNGRALPCPLTTPDADFLHKTFRDMKDAGVDCVVMEVSAHAIDQKRIDGIKFDVGVLTNITQDHLDYFKTFENYEKTKLSFFTKEHIKQGVVCADDVCARKLIENTEVPIITYGLENPSDIFAVNVCYSMEGTHFCGNVCDKIVNIKTNLIGNYNVENCLASLGVCHLLDLDERQLERGLDYIFPVEGRFNVINYCGKYVVIDFAHSPDGLMQVLKTAKTLSDKKLFVVFGCGGNRDKDKRHKMGAIAEKYADFVCLTDDNPRFEKSVDIIADIESGMKKPHFVQPDRKEAIKLAVEKAEVGDIIIVAGKGAEQYQEVEGVKFPFNDADVVYQLFKDADPLKNRGKEW